MLVMCAEACDGGTPIVLVESGICDTTTAGFARDPWSEPSVEAPPATVREAPSGGPPRSYALWYDNPRTAGSNGDTYWLTGDEDFVQSYTVILSEEWPFADNTFQVTYLLDGVQIESEIAGVSQFVHDIPIPAAGRLDVTVRVDHLNFSDGAHRLGIVSSAFPDRALGAPGLHLTVFKNGVEFAPLEPLVTETRPREAFTRPGRMIRSEFGFVGDNAFLAPSSDGSYDLELVVQAVEGEFAACSGDVVVPLAVVAFVDRLQVPFSDGSMMLLVAPRSSEQAILSARLEGLPLDAGHRLDLVRIGGLGFPGQLPSGEFTVWSRGGSGALAVAVW